MTTPLSIGVSARIHHPEGKALDLGGVFTKTLHYLEQSVAHWIMSSNVLVFMIPVIESEGKVKRSDMRLHHYADALDGLVLQGGADIAPETYGEAALHSDWQGDRVRDRYEIELFQAFVDNKKPVLGICRGCQLINVAFGGTPVGKGHHHLIPPHIVRVGQYLSFGQHDARANAPALPDADHRGASRLGQLLDAGLYFVEDCHPCPAS